MPDPDPLPRGSFSMQKFILLIGSANGFSDFDIFDSSYRELFNGIKASDCLSYLNLIGASDLRDPDYKRALKSSAIHFARTILLPKMSFETYGDNWQNNFKTDVFRAELEKSAVDAVRAGEVGKELLEQIGRVRTRIDRDQDGSISGEEILRYLSRKTRILEIQD